MVGGSLSARLWDLDWQALLPLTLASNVVARYSSFSVAQHFIAAHYSSIFEEGDGSSPFNVRSHPAKVRYLEQTSDFVEFTLESETIGLFVAMPSDWSTYYVRSAAVLPEYQGLALPQAFFRKLFPLLAAHGVERVELDTSPANIAMMHIVSRLRFNPSGTLLTDRWGALTRFCKYLQADCEHTFLSQFCAGVKYQTRGRERGFPPTQARKDTP